MPEVAYLDHAATTPLRPEALAAMTPYLTEVFGNPSGMHSVAREAKTGLEIAREEVAAGLGCAPAEVVFTGGGTEADNLAVIGAARAARPCGPAEVGAARTAGAAAGCCAGYSARSCHEYRQRV